MLVTVAMSGPHTTDSSAHPGHASTQPPCPPHGAPPRPPGTPLPAPPVPKAEGKGPHPGLMAPVATLWEQLEALVTLVAQWVAVPYPWPMA